MYKNNAKHRMHLVIDDPGSLIECAEMMAVVGNPDYWFTIAEQVGLPKAAFHSLPTRQAYYECRELVLWASRIGDGERYEEVWLGVDEYGDAVTGSVSRLQLPVLLDWLVVRALVSTFDSHEILGQVVERKMGEFIRREERCDERCQGQCLEPTLVERLWHAGRR